MASLAPPVVFPFPSLSSGFRFRRLISSRRFLRQHGYGCVGRRPNFSVAIRAQTLDLSGSFFEIGDEEGEREPPSGDSMSSLVEKEEPQCPPGLRQYETMAVLRPDMSENERLTLTQKYEELLITGGGMYVEVFNRGVIPLAYGIKKKNRAGESNTYLDGIYLLFTFFTKPESIIPLQTRLTKDDEVIRSSTFKIRKRKY